MISNELDIGPLRERLKSHRRLQVLDFLQEPAADRLHACLRDEVPWEIAQRADLPAPTPPLPVPGAPEEAALLEAAYQRARTGFEFVYDRYRMVDARREGREPGLVLHVVLDFLNSPQFLDFARELTGDSAIRMVSAQAARYRPGHFLTLHSDKAQDEDRAFAYVINLTRAWQSDWGGLLQFVEKGQRISDTFTPHWNSLSLFQVPQAHQVSLVAPWAKEARYSITGWFRRS